ncbi:MAG TPA: hypothetical protein VK525_22170 [Candidatus Saccharimonadales bacterium]|nr:hypothetical protein [Candidatus Saccharimonadales bacterium]
MPNAPPTGIDPPTTLENSPPWIKLLAGNPGVFLAFVWGLAEGTLFFVVPDVLLSLVATVEPRRCWRHVAAATGGALVAGALLYGWAARDMRHARDAIARVPFITSQMLAKEDQSYRARGIAAVFLGPFSGTPYKLYAVAAPAYVRELPFLAATVPARAQRFAIVCLLFGFAASWIRKRWQWPAKRLVAVHAFVWILFYAFYWNLLGRN